MQKRKKILTIIGILLIIVLLAGGTYGYWTWRSANNTTVNFAVTSGFSCSADGGGNITGDGVSLIPATCTNSEHVIKRTITTNVTKSGGDNIYMDLWLNIDTLGSYLVNNADFKYTISTSDSCTQNIVNSGDFSGKTEGGSIELLSSKEYTQSATNTYYLYIWLDKSETEIPPTDITSRQVSLSLGGSCANTKGPNAPVLDNTGMVPVTIANDGTVTTVSENDPSWYNYDNKEWANAVLVKQTGSNTRSYYLSNTNVEVNQDDILAYYVWIPKYSYKMNGTEEAISISFNYEEDGYIQHPAFTFGDDTIDGFWVGKFEATQGTASNIGTGTPTILPNTTSWRDQNISTQFINSLKFSGGTLNTETGAVTYSGSGTYGLANTTNSHMMKNSEWGAVAYLSHSEYGLGTELYINNSGGFITGRSGGNVGGSASTSSGGSYTWLGQEVSSDGTVGNFASDRTLGTKASTTGNVTGVYDMSGGASEYVMGVFSNASGQLWTGYSTSYNSGFNGLYGLNGSGPIGDISFPESKYFDTYKATSGTTISATTGCNGGICYGHALSETSGWYSDFVIFVNASNPWFVRGGYYNVGAGAGAFYFSNFDGFADSSYSWRSVLVVG